MAAYFIDLDGTVFYYDSEDFLPNAVENLRLLRRDGHQIIFTTFRSSWQLKQAASALKKAGLGDCPILHNIESPRIVINDEGAKAINHPTNGPWPAV